jgi:hypothetical protein
MHQSPAGETRHASRTGLEENETAFLFLPKERPHFAVTACFYAGRWRVWMEWLHHGLQFTAVDIATNRYGTSAADARRLCKTLGWKFPDCFVVVWKAVAGRSAVPPANRGRMDHENA